MLKPTRRTYWGFQLSIGPYPSLSSPTAIFTTHKFEFCRSYLSFKMVAVVQSLHCGGEIPQTRKSNRLQKLQSQKALHISYKEDHEEDLEERVVRKKARLCKQRNPKPTSPGVSLVEYNKTCDENTISRPMDSEDSAVIDSAYIAGMSVGLTEVGETGAKGEAKSAYTLVMETLREFNKRYLHCVQEENRRGQEYEERQKTTKGSNCEEENWKGQQYEECQKITKCSKGQKTTKRQSKKESAPEKKISRRPDLKAVSQMMQTNAVLYPKKQIGSIPGIGIGHQFFSRAEMVVVGFHSHWLNGIDYIGETDRKDYPQYTLPIATVIVISGQYEDDLDNREEVVYTGQGGNDLLGNKRQIKDQVMERGNLGLKNSMDQKVPIRVVRGHQSKSSYVGKVYTYDGLYEVVENWPEKGISGFTVFKFRLKRVEDQPLLTTGQVHFTNGRIPKSISEIRGLVCKDISGGQEYIPIPATNSVDNPPVAPTGYKYVKELQVPKGLRLPKNQPAPGCGCKGDCTDPNRCACAKLNGSDFPYVYMKRNNVKLGRLVEPKDIVFECGPNCGCGPDCVNRTSQRGITFRLEVFKTPNKGWGVRSWDHIPSGSFVCEYIGILGKTEELDPAVENYYVFDIDCLQTMKGLEGRQRRQRDVTVPAYMDETGETGDDNSESTPEFCIDGCSVGNVTRFINHSCQPNLFVQCVLSEHRNIKQARIVLFAADNIPPLQELSYDYGYPIDSVVGPDGKIRKIECNCGAFDCRKRLL